MREKPLSEQLSYFDWREKGQDTYQRDVSGGMELLRCKPTQQDGALSYSFLRSGELHGGGFEVTYRGHGPVGFWAPVFTGDHRVTCMMEYVPGTSGIPWLTVTDSETGHRWKFPGLIPDTEVADYTVSMENALAFQSPTKKMADEGSNIRRFHKQ